MAGTEASSKEILKAGRQIEDDPISSELDNYVEDEVRTEDNEIEAEGGESETETETETETESKETAEENQLDKIPEVQVKDDSLVSPEGNVSVNIENETEQGTDTTGMELTQEEKEASGEISQKPSDIFDTKTGASRIMGEDTEDPAQQEEAAREEAGPETEKDNVFDANTGAGEVMKISKPKKILFSTILGFKRAAKGIGNFFKKKLPKAFKSGAAVAKKVLKYTPVAPLVTLVDQVIEYREKTRPQREEKARLKKEAKEKEKAKWLEDQDEQRHKKEEQKRIEKEKKELEAKQKAALWEEKKRRGSFDYKAWKFFSDRWKNIKTGASWIGRKIKESKLGVFGAKTIKKVKGIVNEAKVRVVGVIGVVANKVGQITDEYDAFSFEDRMQRVDAEEKAQKERGMDVPEQDYRTRYLALTDRLRTMLEPIRKNIKRREEIEEALSEVEGNSTPPESVTTKSGEEVNTGEWTEKVQDRGAGSDLANTIIDVAGTVIPKIIPYADNNVFDLAKSLSKMGAEIGKAADFRERKKLMDAIVATTKDQLIRRMSKYAKDNAEIKEITAGFDAALNAMDAVGKVGTLTGMAAVSTGVSAVKNITTGIKSVVTSSKTRAGVKNGIKEMLGGRDGYYKLKAEFRMHAPEMRRAVRDALGVASSEDAVTADKWELSHLMSERAKQGAMDKETERMVAEAGGKSERSFDTLQGAGSKVRRRLANRRVRIVS